MGCLNFLWVLSVLPGCFSSALVTLNLGNWFFMLWIPEVLCLSLLSLELFRSLLCNSGDFFLIYYKMQKLPIKKIINCRSYYLLNAVSLDLIV